MAKGLVRALVVGLLVGGWLGGPAAAQGPFSAQIQRALANFAAAPVFTGTATFVDGSTWGASGPIITAASLVRFGGSTNSFPALKRSGTALHLRLADDSAFAALSAGTGTFTTVESNNAYNFTSAGGFDAPSNGVFRMLNSAQTDFGRLCFGLCSSSFPALKRSTTELHVKLADDSAFASLRALTLMAGGDIVVRAAGSFAFSGTSDPSGSTDTSLTRAAAGVLRLTNGTRSFDVNAATQPTCTANCGTDPSVSGTNSSFTVTMGATGSPASGWVITFGTAFATAPQCHASMALAGMAVGKLPLTLAATTTNLTVVTNGTAPANSDKYHVTCFLGS